MVQQQDLHTVSRHIWKGLTHVQEQHATKQHCKSLVQHACGAYLFAQSSFKRQLTVLQVSGKNSARLLLPQMPCQTLNLTTECGKSCTI